MYSFVVTKGVQQSEKTQHGGGLILLEAKSVMAFKREVRGQASLTKNSM